MGRFRQWSSGDSQLGSGLASTLAGLQRDEIARDQPSTPCPGDTPRTDWGASRFVRLPACSRLLLVASQALQSAARLSHSYEKFRVFEIQDITLNVTQVYFAARTNVRYCLHPANAFLNPAGFLRRREALAQRVLRDHPRVQELHQVVGPPGLRADPRHPVASERLAANDRPGSGPV